MTMLDLRPEQKAAALVVAVGSKQASTLLQYLSEEEVETLAAEVARLGRVRPEVVEAVLDEVYEEAAAQRLIAAGGIDYARELLTEWKGSQGAEIIERLLADLNVTPFNFVRDIEPEQLVHILKDEHPQTVALILAHQPASYSAEVLRAFGTDMQNEAALRIATMGRTSPEVIALVEQALQTRLGTVSSAEVTVRGGVEDLAEVLNNTDRATEQAILDRLTRFDPAVAERVRALMFVFEDVATLDNRSIQKVLQGIDSKTLALAMKGVRQDVQQAILDNVSTRARDALLEEIDLLGAVRRRDVETAQSEVVAQVRRLDEAGEIVLSRGGEGDLVE